MSDDFDSQLRQLFADSREPMDADAFVASVQLQIERSRRLRMWGQLLAVAAALIALALNLSWALPKAAWLVEAAGERSSAGAGLLVTPLGWAASMIAGGYVLWRTRAARPNRLAHHARRRRMTSSPLK
jgi:hypothetical protein